MAQPIIKTRRAEVVALGGEVAAGKRLRQPAWYEADMIFPEFTEMARDLQAQDRLTEMDAEVMNEIKSRRA